MKKFNIYYGFTGSHEWTSSVETISAESYEDAEDYTYARALEAMNDFDEQDGSYDLIAVFNVEEV